MKKLLPFVTISAILLLSACSSKPKEYKFLKVRTANTFGWLFCEFDTDVNGLQKYIKDGWRIESEDTFSYRTHNVWTDQSLQCVGKNVTLVK